MFLVELLNTFFKCDDVFIDFFTYSWYGKWSLDMQHWIDRKGQKNGRKIDRKTDRKGQKNGRKGQKNWKKKVSLRSEKFISKPTCLYHEWLDRIACLELAKSRLQSAKSRSITSLSLFCFLFSSCFPHIFLFFPVSGGIKICAFHSFGLSPGTFFLCRGGG